MIDIWHLISDWRFLVIALTFLISLPLIFYISSFDKSPPKIIKIEIKNKKLAKIPNPSRPAEEQTEQEAQKSSPQQTARMRKKVRLKSDERLK